MQQLIFFGGLILLLFAGPIIGVVSRFRAKSTRDAMVALTLTTLSWLLLLLFVTPRMKEIFNGFGTELPTSTVLLISLSDLACMNLFHVCYCTVGVVAGGVSLIRFGQSDKANRKATNVCWVLFSLLNLVLMMMAVLALAVPFQNTIRELA